MSFEVKKNLVTVLSKNMVRSFSKAHSPYIKEKKTESLINLSATQLQYFPCLMSPF